MISYINLKINIFEKITTLTILLSYSSFTYEKNRYNYSYPLILLSLIDEYFEENITDD
jgi:hypothetical protein